MDFAQNYLNKYQDEPQSVHWHHQQTVLHPVVNYYKCPQTNKTITEEHMLVTNDLKHDRCAVDAFQAKSLEHLKSNGLKLKKIIQFSDNCLSKYKSKGPFEIISLSSTPIIRFFFGSRHGKGPADGAIGRAKQATNNAHKSGAFIMCEAFECSIFLESHY